MTPADLKGAGGGTSKHEEGVPPPATGGGSPELETRNSRGVPLLASRDRAGAVS